MSLANKIENGIALDPAKILKLVNEFSKSSELFISTGGVHSCALCSYDEILYFEEDIGRHNAMDKLSGSVLVNKIYAGNKIILTTGRISSEIITKAAKIGIPVLVSRSAPTDAAIEMALQLNITLIGFARGQSLNIYT
jgi:FdhD protein